MSFLTQPDFWVRWLQIVLIDLVLAGDNALVIALAVRTLPPREQFWGRIWGTAGAVILRLAFIAMVTFLLRIPLLQLVGVLCSSGSRSSWCGLATQMKGPPARSVPA
jgi:predicted tellurium resistance membrane protein TerC